MYQLSLVCSCNTKECKYSMSVILRHMTTQIIKNSFCYWMNIYWSGSLVVIYCCHFSFILGRLTDWSMYKWNSYFMLCHHAYLHGKSLTTIFSVVFCYMTLHYTSEKPLTPTGWLCISKWLPSSLHDCQSVTLWASQLISQEQDSPSVNHSVVLSTSQSVGQSAIQSVALLASLSDSLLLCWSVSQAVSCHSAS